MRKTLEKTEIWEKGLWLDNEKIVFNTDDRLIGEGGTCLVYSAHIESDGRKIILKEFFPVVSRLQNDIFINRDDKTGAVSGIDNINKKNLECWVKKERFTCSFEKNIGLRNKKALNKYFVTPRNIANANGTTYITMEYDAMETIDQYFNDSVRNEEMSSDQRLYEIFMSMKKAAEVLYQIHNNGYVHLDITPNNLFFCSKGQDENDIKMLDVDSFVEQDKLQKNEVYLSCSNGYSAPEIVEKRNINIYGDDIADYNINGVKADIYSIGAILYKLIMGEKLDITYANGVLDESKVEELLELHSYQSTLKEKIKEANVNCQRHGVELIVELIENCISRNVDRRYKNMQEVKDKIEEVLKWINPNTKVCIVDSYCPNQCIVRGRENKVKEIETAFTKKKTKSRIVCITGIGGIGKSTLAREYARIHEREYEVIVEVVADSAINAIGQIQLLNSENTKKIEEKIEQISNINQNQKMLLIVHDYNTNNDTEFELWSKLRCDVLLTSWNVDWGGEVDTVSLNSSMQEINEMDSASQMFHDYYLMNAYQSKDERWIERLRNILASEKEEVQQIVQTVQYHPLCIKVLAMQAAYISGSEDWPKTILSNIKRIGIERTSAEFKNFKDRGNEQSGDALYHLETIFVSAIETQKLEGDEKEILRYFRIVPSSTGISASRFDKWTGMSVASKLELLKRKGWLEYNAKGKDLLDNATNKTEGTYSLPMVIQQGLKNNKQMISNKYNSARFYKKCLGLDVALYKDELILYQVIEQIGVLCINFSFSNNYDEANMLNKLGIIKGQYTSNNIGEVLPVYENALGKLREGNKKDDILAAAIYGNIALMHNYNHSKESWFNNMKKAAIIYKKYPIASAMQTIDIACFLHNEGLSLEGKDSIKRLKRSCKIFEMLYKKYKREDAKIYLGYNYMNLAEVYKKLNKDNIANRYDTKVLQFIGENDELAAAYWGKKGIELYNQGKREEGLFLIEKVVNIIDNISTSGSGKADADTVIYYHLGTEKRVYGDYDFARKCSEQIIELYNKNSEIMCIKGYAAHANMVIAECNIRQHINKVEEYLQNALCILDVDSEETIALKADLYKDVGVLYEKIKKPKESISCFEKALALYTNDVDTNVEKIVDVYHSMGYIYLIEKYYDKSLNAIGAVIRYYKEGMNIDSFTIAKCYLIYGLAYVCKGNKQMGRKYLEEANKLFTVLGKEGSYEANVCKGKLNELNKIK